MCPSLIVTPLVAVVTFKILNPRCYSKVQPAMQIVIGVEMAYLGSVDNTTGFEVRALQLWEDTDQEQQTMAIWCTAERCICTA